MTWDAIRLALERELAERISVDGLTGPQARCGAWQIAQRVAGHRHSADDVLTAWYAAEHASPDVARVLDLGTGIGSVGLLVLSRLAPTATLVGIEAQAISHRLLLANIAGNALGDRVSPLHGDLRELALDERFPLVTGSPPYFPVGTGVLPEDAQKAGARFELRGDVSDYARAAARHLADDGTFVFCFPTPQRPRALAAVAAAGLHVEGYRDVVPRESLSPLFTLFRARRRSTPVVIEEPFVVRHADGSLTEAMRGVRQQFGF